jgi:hypothetical protein
MPKAKKPKLDPWEHAMTCPLPMGTSYQLLETLRKDILVYLDWATHDLPQGDLWASLREIQRVADRLTRITTMIPAALEAAIENDFKGEKNQ